MNRTLVLDNSDSRDLVGISEFVKDRLYFATFKNAKDRPSSPKYHYFSTDETHVYLNFFGDFGPLSLSPLYRYCDSLHKKLNSPNLRGKIIVQYTSLNQKKRANAAFLIGCYAIIHLKFSPIDVRKALNNSKIPFQSFQDASEENSKYTLELHDCFSAVYKAKQYNFFDFNDFDVDELDKYEKIQFGDINWIVPDKFLAFSGPNTVEANTCYHPPEFYLDYFLRNGVQLVVRLNQKNYDEKKFTAAGIDHIDMYFPDGTSPPNDILCNFMKIVEKYKGPVAVHCKAGLGRTGCLIGAYLIKHYKMSALEAIAWMRICRPGCVIGSQQDWLKQVQDLLQTVGEKHRSVRLRHSNIQKHTYGLYSVQKKRLVNQKNLDSKEYLGDLNKHRGNPQEKISRITNKENNREMHSRKLLPLIEPKIEAPNKNFMLTNITRPLTILYKKKVSVIVPHRETQADRLMEAKCHNRTPRKSKT